MIVVVCTSLNFDSDEFCIQIIFNQFQHYICIFIYIFFVAEIIMLDGLTTVYRSSVDLYFYVMGSQYENEVCSNHHFEFDNANLKSHQQLRKS